MGAASIQRGTFFMLMNIKFWMRYCIFEKKGISLHLLTKYRDNTGMTGFDSV